MIRNLLNILIILLFYQTNALSDKLNITCKKKLKSGEIYSIAYELDMEKGQAFLDMDNNKEGYKFWMNNRKILIVTDQEKNYFVVDIKRDTGQMKVSAYELKSVNELDILWDGAEEMVDSRVIDITKRNFVNVALQKSFEKYFKPSKVGYYNCDKSAVNKF